MRNLTCLLAFLICAATVKAATSITSSTVSGHWTLAGSPYKIFNDVSVVDTLKIDAGVEVIFQGYYKMNVWGCLYAKGNTSQYINFRMGDTSGFSNPGVTTGGWSGLSFLSITPPTTVDSFISYCNFSDIKGGQIKINKKTIKFSHCNFFHNRSLALIDNTTDSLYKFEMDACKFYNNYSNDNYSWVINISGIAAGDIYIHNCDFNENTASSVLNCYRVNLLLQDNQFRNNYQEDNTFMVGTIGIFNSNAVIKGNFVYKNTQQYDGALLCSNTFADIYGNQFLNNQSLIGYTGSSACGAIQGGGAIRISASDSAMNYYCTIRNNVMANNYAALTGGAIYVYMISVEIYNNQIVNNMAGTSSGANAAAGIDVFNHVETAGRNKVNIRNNLFLDNVRYIGSSNLYNVVVGAGDTVIYENNWSQNPLYLDVSTAGFGCTLLGDSTTNIVGADPQLINPTVTSGVTEDAQNSDFRLKPGSSCIDKGSDIGIAPGPFDCWNNARVYNGTIDIGAYEYNPTAYAHTGTETIVKNSLKIYPNPATNTLLISTPEANGTIQLHDISGRQIAEKDVENTLTTFDIHELPRGLYFATWTSTANERIIEKVIVQ